ncbi:MAG: glycosyltransferase [Verrucomicrobiota bacterium]
MPHPPPNILLVTPVWNDSARLAGYGPELATVLAATALPIRWIIADDGSEPSEHARLAELLEEFAAVYPQVTLHFAAAHYGKGSVIREAWALDSQVGWLAFVDADGAVSAAQIVGLIEAAVAADRSVMGIRKRTPGTHIEESFYRGVLHRVFLAVADGMLGMHSQDLQCGAKVLRGEDYRRIAPGLREPGLAFDSELLCALHHSGAAWQEIPVSWTQKNGGKVHPLRDAWGMFKALYRVRRRFRRGSLP